MKKLIKILSISVILLVALIYVWNIFVLDNLPIYWRGNSDCNRIILLINQGVNEEAVGELASKYNLRIKLEIQETNTYELQTKGLLCSTEKRNLTISELQEEPIVESAVRNLYETPF